MQPERKKKINEIKQKIWNATKGYKEADIITACNSLSKYLSSKRRSERRIRMLKSELRELESKRNKEGF